MNISGNKSLTVMQCGLSFGLVLRKRQILRECFDDFDYDKVAAFDDSDVARIMDKDGMIKAKRKIPLETLKKLTELM